MGSVCVSSFRCCMFVSVVHPVAILSAVFCIVGLVMDLYVVFFCFPMLLM